jgi:hypothetical protein
MSTLSNFGEQFSSKVLKKYYQNAVTPSIVNRDYEGEIKKPGDRVNILSFLNDALMSDYAVGTDMNLEQIIDNEDTLVVEKRKYFNFSLDRLEKLFTYGGDIPENLLENRAAVLEREIDKYVLTKGTDAKAGSWIGMDVRVNGLTHTQASVVTTATGGTVTLLADSTVEASNIGVVEQPGDAALVHAGFEAADVGKGFRLRSTATYVSPWWKITAVTSSVSATITEWDGETTGSDFASEQAPSLRGIYGGDGITFNRYGDGPRTLITQQLTQAGMGWEIQAARATAISAASVYDQVTLLAEKLNANEVPAEDRWLVVPPEIKTMLLQASETQPTGIADLYKGTVVNGKFMRMGGFDIHVATSNRFSSRVGHKTGDDSDVALTGSNGYLIVAGHKGFITYADKWSESRVVDAENQFAKKYQGLYLYGALVTSYGRKLGAILYGNY